MLSRGGFPLKIQPQPLRMLELLVTRAPEVVTREELSDSVWGNGVNVDLEQSLNFCVRQIRSVLNDSASNPKFIDTLPKQGYRFIGDVEREAEQPAVAAVSVSGKPESLFGGSEVGIAVSGAPDQRQRSKMLVWSGGVVALLTLAAAAYLVVASRNSIPPLRVSAYTQITHDGHAKELKGTDGSRLYFAQGEHQPGPIGLGQVAISGGAIAPSRWRCLARPWWMFPGWIHFSRQVINGGRPAGSLPPVECSDPGWFGPPPVGSRGCGLESRRKHGCLLNRGRRYPPHSERWRGGSEVGFGWKPGYFDLLVARRQDHPIYRKGSGPLGNVFQRV